MNISIITNPISSKIKFIPKLCVACCCAFMFLSMPAQAGKVKFLISGGSITPILGKVSFDGSSEASGDSGGYGFAFDFGRGSSSFALDYYTQSGGKIDIAGVTGVVSANSWFLGGRWHHSSGFYAGGGILPTTTSTKAAGANLGTSGLAFPWALTLGYDYKTPSGFVVGVHWLYSIPSTALLATTGEANNFNVHSISLGLGYDW